MFSAGIHYAYQDRFIETFCNLKTSGPSRPSSFWPPVREGFSESPGRYFTFLAFCQAAIRYVKSDSLLRYQGATREALRTTLQLAQVHDAPPACRYAAGIHPGTAGDVRRDAIDIYDQIDKEEPK